MQYQTMFIPISPYHFLYLTTILRNRWAVSTALSFFFFFRMHLDCIQLIIAYY